MGWTIIRRSAGLWGPGLFAGAAVLAPRLQPGYRHRSHHVSGLAALGERSAFVMVPGFAALGASYLLAPMPSRTMTAVARVSGLTTIAAGAIPASTPDCPRPGRDAEATRIDVGHTVFSVATFALWMSLPFLAARRAGPAWFTRASGTIGRAGFVTFLGTAATIQVNSSWKGAAQRSFLGSMFAWHVLNAARSVLRRSGD